MSFASSAPDICAERPSAYSRSMSSRPSAEFGERAKVPRLATAGHTPLQCSCADVGQGDPLLDVSTRHPHRALFGYRHDPQRDEVALFGSAGQ